MSIKDVISEEQMSENKHTYIFFTFNIQAG